MNNQNPFKWRHDEADIILLCVRWYLRYSLSYRDLEEMMRERGLHVDHTTIYRWVQRYAPELEQRCKLDVPLSRCGFARKHLGISAQSHTRCRGRQTLLHKNAGCASYHHPSCDLGR